MFYSCSRESVGAVARRNKFLESGSAVRMAVVEQMLCTEEGPRFNHFNSQQGRLGNSSA